jgi:hypothetical protein
MTRAYPRPGAVALLALAAVLATACGPEQASAGPDAATAATVDGAGSLATPPATGAGQLTGKPAATAPPTPPAVRQGPTRGAPAYPGTAQAYAQAVMDAWTADDAIDMQALATEEVYYGIFGLNASGYDDWSFLRCDGTAGSSYCSFVNDDDGDVVTLRISHQLLGQAHAAIGVKLDKTTYPDDGVSYVKEFIDAWKFGNTVRMLLLSTPEVVDEVPGPPTTTVTYPEPTCCGGGLVQVKAVWSGSTKRFDVGTSLLGGPHAILDYTLVLGFTG